MEDVQLHASILTLSSTPKIGREGISHQPDEQPDCATRVRSISESRHAPDTAGCREYGRIFGAFVGGSYNGKRAVCGALACRLCAIQGGGFRWAYTIDC